MIYLHRLLDDTNIKCIATNMLAKLIFQDHVDQKSGLFQDQSNSQFRDFCMPNFFIAFWKFSGPIGPGTLQKTLVIYSRLRTVKSLPKANQLPSSSWILMTKYRLEWSSCSIAIDGYPSSGHWANSSPEVTINNKQNMCKGWIKNEISNSWRYHGTMHQNL